MSYGSLFSGIGGLDLGLEWAGHGPCSFQVEIDPFCSAVLAKHWPDVPRFDDVRTVGAHNLPYVDILAGGSPCQGHSQAGKRKGFDDVRSALWFEYARVVSELRPRVVIWENVIEAFRSGAAAVVAADLRALGYDGEPFILDAVDDGASHRRKRVWIVAYRRDDGRQGQPPGDCSEGALDQQGGHDADRRGLAGIRGRLGPAAEPGVGSQAHGVPAGMVRPAFTGPRGGVIQVSEPARTLQKPYPLNKREAIHAFGNAVVPAMAERIGRMVKP